MMHGIAVLAIGLALGALLLLGEKLAGPLLGIVPMVLTLAGWTALVVMLGQTQRDQLAELVIAVTVIGAVAWHTLK